jgi:hypothetical protein
MMARDKTNIPVSQPSVEAPESLWPTDLARCLICHSDIAREECGTHGLNRATLELLCPTVCTFPLPSPDDIAEKVERVTTMIIGRERLDYDWVRDIIVAEFGGGENKS